MRRTDAAIDRRRLLRGALAGLLCLTATPGPAAPTLSAADLAVLTQAMWVMARLWNQALGGTGGGLGLDWNTWTGAGTLPFSAGPWAGATPWRGSWTPSNPTTPGNPPWSPWPGAGTTARPPAPIPQGQGPALDGLWMAASGVVLWIQGERFILMREGRVLSLGTVRLEGKRLWLRDARTGLTQGYTAAFDGQRLTLSDARGRSVQYRRLPARTPG